MKRRPTPPSFNATPFTGRSTAPAHPAGGGGAWCRRGLLAVLALGLLTGVPAQAAGPLPMAVTAATNGKAAAKAQSQERSVLRQKPVAVQLQHLDPQSGSLPPQVGVELFDGAIMTLDLQRVEQRGADNYTWHGKVQGYNKSRVTLSVVDGQLAGTIVLVDDASQPGGLYQIQSGPDGVPTLRQLDPNGFPPDHPRPPTAAGKTSSAAGDTFASSAPTTTAAADSGATIDVMIVYSNQTAAAAGAGIGAQVQQAVDTANAVYANSGISTRLRLVHAEQVNYGESGDFNTDLNWLTGNATVAALRNSYGADMVSLFIENGQYCGMAWIGPSAGSAFSVVNRGCASGNYSFPHELGHNFGALHDPYVDPGSSPYAFGHGITDPSEGWRDVMAYNNACAAAGTSCTRIGYFSNPNLSYGNPLHPLGTTSTSDVARVHNQNAATVANFRAAVSGGCTYTFSPGSATVGAASGSGSFSVTAGAGCAWNSASNASWLAVAAGSGTTDSGTLNYSVAANSGAARSGTLTVGGQTFTVNQAAACSYSLTPTSASAAAGGGSGSTSLVTTAGCAWTASSSVSWLTLTSASSGSGNATVSYSVAANTGAARSTNLTLGGITFMVTQDAAPAPVPAPAPTATAPTATLSSTALAFGSQKVGTTSAAKSVKLTNGGGGTLTISSLSPGGPNPDDFPVSDACTSSTALTSGQSCTLQYTFKPGANGKRSANVGIATNAGTVSLSLSGQGSRK